MQLEILRCPYSSNKTLIDYWTEINYQFYKSVGYNDTIDDMRQSTIKNWEEAYRRYQSQNISEMMPVTKWIVLDKIERTVIGYANVQYRVIDPDQLPTFAYFFIYVKDEYRRKNVGSKLLKQVRSDLVGYSLKTIFSFAEDEISNNFLTKNEGIITEDGAVYQLDLIKNKSLLLDIVKNRSNESTSIHINPKEDFYHDIIDVYNASRLKEPGSDTFQKHTRLSADALFSLNDRQQGANIYGITRVDDHIVGLTHLFINDTLEKICFQKYTGVDPQFMGRGIATRLKAKIYLWIMEKYAQMQYIDTETVAENVSSYRVNQKLGYHLLRPQITFEFKIM